MVRFGAKKVDSFHLFYFIQKRGLFSPLFCFVTHWFLAYCVAFAHFRPIDNLKERFDIIWTSVLVI